ncbi:hypothetical protein RCO27_07765 [Sphingosinicella sp. LHD-64]|uniref:hypothetical protein n=1 Tax=Sphingosinicella sp. LHD-64 TaxID=3072139 RepID=UPI00280F1B1A|nr:hypothetical protein [Sphingosinicella sp. LHD-64]MDQ8756126.1 hypothetical protein [Sphingosinicella sp. LHD-64]
MRLLALLGLMFCLAAPLRAQPAVPPGVTEVVILGVDHSAQLINRRQQPGAMRAFFEASAPSAICIERAPERVARNDHYEFTYEIQDIIVPWAREMSLPLCPFDWLPSPDDSALALGIADLEAPPFVRRESGFQGFLTFPEARSRTLGLFFADGPEERARYREFYAAYPDAPARDFARRLFIYRTFMQARRIASAARNYSGRRMLVVVGVMHKDDIESILAAYPWVRVVQPSAIAAEPDAAAIARHTRPEDLAAIASFNLLGTQWRDANLDRAWMRETVEALRRQRPGPESDLFAARLAELEGAPARASLAEYLRIAGAAGDAGFTYTGVRDRSRIDSFFGPFGNLNVAQRASVEAARVHHGLGERDATETIRLRLRQALDGELKRLQLDGYWARYVAVTG